MPQPERVREIYLREYRTYSGKPNYGRGPLPHLDGGVTSMGRRCKSVWGPLAAKFETLTIDPELYIPWLFANSSVLPLPNQMLSPKTVTVFREHHNPRVMEERAALEFQVDLTQFQMTLTPKLKCYWPEDAVRLTLQDEDVNKARPLFRFCFGVLYQMPDICSRYLAAARLQYMENRQAYDRIWDGSLLAGLRTEHG